MKVLMFGWEFPPYISGGLGTACYGLTKELSKKEVNVTFVLPKIKGEMKNSFLRIIGGHNFLVEEVRKLDDEYQFQKFIHVDSPLTPYLNEESYKLQLEEEKKILSEYKSHSIDFAGDYGSDLVNEVVRFSIMGKYLARKESYDIIHAHDWLTFLAGIEAKKVSGKPLVVHIHATEIDRCGENGNPEIFNIEKYGMEVADKVIAVSNRTKTMIIEHYGIAPDKIRVVHNGVEREGDYLKNPIGRYFKNDKIVLYLGRITMQKGPDYFIEAANLVLQRMENVRFVMAGSGDMTRRLVERMAALRIADRFHFTGFLGAEDREKVFSMSDLYVMPSVSEPFGITPLEAMRHNIPVIISKQSGVGEVLSNAIKVDFWDIHKLASTIINVLENPALSQEIVKKHDQILGFMNWGIAADKVVDVYRELL